MKLLVVTLPALNKSVALQYDDNTTEDVACYLLDVAPGVDLRTVPPSPDGKMRVPLTPLITANLVLALAQMIQKAAQDG